MISGDNSVSLSNLKNNQIQGKVIRLGYSGIFYAPADKTVTVIPFDVVADNTDPNGSAFSYNTTTGELTITSDLVSAVIAHFHFRMKCVAGLSTYIERTRNGTKSTFVGMGDTNPSTSNTAYTSAAYARTHREGTAIIPVQRGDKITFSMYTQNHSTDFLEGGGANAAWVGAEIMTI